MDYQDSDPNLVYSYSRWLDKLGVAAREGVKVVMRQTFYGGNYALLANDMKPNPVLELYMY